MTLYIFLVACVPPYKAPGSIAPVNGSSVSSTRHSLLEQQQQLSISAAGTNGGNAGSSSSSGGGGGSNTTAGLPAAPQRPPKPNAYVSGFVFMHETEEPVLTTQVRLASGAIRALHGCMHLACARQATWPPSAFH